MPGACARTATLALTQVTLPCALKLAGLGLTEALRQDAGLREGLEIHAGRVTHAGLARELGEPASDAVAAVAP
jgi:alanine dehydrogenase